MVIHKNVDRADTRLTTISAPLVNNPLVSWISVIIIGAYQSVTEYTRWPYETVSDFTICRS